MHAIRVEINGFRRLRSTNCNVDARLVAFLGPNEAGKSSLLDALNWFQVGGTLPARDRYRPAKPSAADLVVSVTYRVAREDSEALGDLRDQVEDLPTSILCRRPASGETVIVRIAPPVRRRARPFAAAQASVTRVREQLSAGEVDPALGIDTAALDAALAAAYDELASPDIPWADENPATSVASAALQIAAETRVDDESEPAALPWAESFTDCATELMEAVRINRSPHPEESVRQTLLRRRPAFLKFSDADRNLLPEYDISDEALRTDPPKALSNVLGVADVSIDELWAALQGEDVSALRSLESLMNDNLRLRVQPSWRQSKLTLEVHINESGLIEVLVKEFDSAKAPPRISVAERSDGLRTFLALSCFLGARGPSRPPILLIDELETHLHLDAQADLISLLSSDAEVGQVLYTTHSPGALPLDLGTGLRFVSRDTNEPRASVLTNSFWDQNSPGFSRLLFAMGAGGAAFSAFRRALVCEGAAEMILLPTLLRLARDGQQVEFQVAPGLSSAASIDPALRDIAIDTAFLVDGDESGDKMAKKLREEAGYSAESIFQLPPGKALEDLIEPDDYTEVVQELMAETGSGATLDRGALDGTLCIASAIDKWAEETGTKVPGHVVQAVRLAANPSRIRLTADAQRELRALYEQIMLWLQRHSEGSDH